MKICKEVPYINRIYQNIKSIKKEKFRKFYNDLFSAECIIPIGEGRSQCALYIGLGQIKKEIKTLDDIEFPGRNIEEAAPVLEKKYSRISLLVNSGSGETTTPRKIIEELFRYIEATGTEKFTINAIVSNPKSAIGMINEREYGSVVELKGRERIPKSAGEFLKHGIMNDIYELGSLMLIQKVKEAINEGESYNSVFKRMDEEMRVIGEIIDEWVASDVYNSMVENMEKRGHVIVGGLRIARIVALMTVIRLQHVKRAVGDEAYVAGALAPKPRAGDILILISWSGETEPLLKWCRESKTFGVYAYSVVGRESTLSSTTKSIVMSSQPLEFYERAAFILSPLPLKLVERLDSKGLKLPEYIMEWYHTVTQ
jgi:6-phospho-3-hexuloisomerase